MLDVDANGCDGRTMTPVENIRWDNRTAKNGHYTFYVHNYRDRNDLNNPYRVELQVGDKTYTCSGFMRRTGEQNRVFAFDYENGEVRNLITLNDIDIGADSDNGKVWGLSRNRFVEVKGIVGSPNTWRDETNNTNGRHIFFLLNGCQDTSSGKGRGFFNEILKSELREMRKTLEMYTANTPIEGMEEADACGVGYLEGSDWNVTVRVTSGGTQRVIKIDRFD